MSHPEAFCLIEFTSIAHGTRAVDRLIKKAPVRIEKFGTVQPGRLAVAFSGDVASVEEAHGEVFDRHIDAVYDAILLPQIHAEVHRAAMGDVASFVGDTLGVIESETMAGAVAAADVAVKGALVQVAEIRLGDELGGKGVAHLLGAQHDVEEMADLVATHADNAVRALRISITPRVDAELLALLNGATRFWGSTT